MKADVNAYTFGGNTPLHLAASLGSPTLCSMLVAAGETLNENMAPLGSQVGPPANTKLTGPRS